jgi:hypothetical protein
VTPAIVPGLSVKLGPGAGESDALDDVDSVGVEEVGKDELNCVVKTSDVVTKLEVETPTVDVCLGVGAPGGLNSVLLIAFDTSALRQRISKAGAERIVPS